MNCRIIRNLVYDFVLGWDFFSKYNCAIHPGEGFFSFENERVEFFRDSLEISSTHFALAEDTVIPAFSKVITQASFNINPHDNPRTSDTVEVMPLESQIAKVAVGRSVAKVKDGRFPVELLNPYPGAVTIPAGELLGHIHFTNDELLKGTTHSTEIELQYNGEDSGYESEDNPEGTPEKSAPKPT